MFKFELRDGPRQTRGQRSIQILLNSERMGRKSRTRQVQKSMVSERVAVVDDDQQQHQQQQVQSSAAAVVNDKQEPDFFSDPDPDDVDDLVQSSQIEHLNEIISEVSPKSRSVIYVGHLPFGFFEKELHGYFSQFGTIVKLRMSRNPKVIMTAHIFFTSLLISSPSRL